MKYFKQNNVKLLFSSLSAIQFFFISILICLIFYFFEGFLGIDRFYHPDSKHYLTNYYDFKLEKYLKNPFIITDLTYYHITNLLRDNYYLLLALNFILYSITNAIIYKKVFLRYFNILSNLKLIFLFYLLFLDPYRLHLASHILKETFLIFFMIIIVVSNLKIIKILSVFFLEWFRPNSWLYILIFLTYSKVKFFFKKINFYFKPKFIYIIFFLIILVMIIFLFNYDKYIFNLIRNIFDEIVSRMKWYDARIMPLRSFDHVVQFKDLGFPLGFIAKNISWPLLLVSGMFIFFVSSILFKLLGTIIILNNFLIYTIAKKSFISLGLVVILLMISVYTTSYTAMFRYSYIALYPSIVYFFLKLDLKKL